MDSDDNLLAALFVSIAINLMLAIKFMEVRRAVAKRVHPAACRTCGYDTRTTLGGRCPECGEPVPDRTPVSTLTHCSFCSRSSRETGPQAEGPDGAYICAPCVELCHIVILKNRAEQKSSN
jgi:hypothetical protein